MALFILGLIIFFASHLFTAWARGPRQALVDRLGAMGYKGLYSLASIAGFALIVMGWPKADASIVYVSPYWLRHVAYLLTLIAFIALSAAYLPKGRIAATLKHPMLVGVKFWALAHLLVNGEVRSIILFGSFLAYGVVDRIAVKRRGDNGPAASAPIGDLLAVVAGVVGWAAVYVYLHPIIAGVALR